VTFVVRTLGEALFESRAASLERLVGFYVLFHAMAARVARALAPLGLGYDTWRSQSGTRVQTTPAPVTLGGAAGGGGGGGGDGDDDDVGGVADGSGLTVRRTLGQELEKTLKCVAPRTLFFSSSYSLSLR